MNLLKISTTLILMLATSILTAQEFSFTMVFEDSMGNRDSLLFGYDPDASWGIDQEFGEINSKRQLGMIYGINRTTINEWIKKYDRKNLMNTRILVETNDETSRINALQKEIKQLKGLLIKKDLDKLVYG